MNSKLHRSALVLNEHFTLFSIFLFYHRLQLPFYAGLDTDNIVVLFKLSFLLLFLFYYISIIIYLFSQMSYRGITWPTLLPLLRVWTNYCGTLEHDVLFLIHLRFYVFITSKTPINANNSTLTNIKYEIIFFLKFLFLFLNFSIFENLEFYWSRILCKL